MDINELNAIVKKKLNDQIKIENIKVEDKSFLQKNHPSNQRDKYHLKISIESSELRKISRIDSNKKIHKILKNEIKHFIHSLQILIH